jgi:hypothetical protein
MLIVFDDVFDSVITHVADLKSLKLPVPPIVVMLTKKDIYKTYFNRELNENTPDIAIYDKKYFYSMFNINSLN